MGYSVPSLIMLLIASSSAFAGPYYLKPLGKTDVASFNDTSIKKILQDTQVKILVCSSSPSNDDIPISISDNTGNSVSISTSELRDNKELENDFCETEVAASPQVNVSHASR
jgi:hypothetical protein